MNSVIFRRRQVLTGLMVTGISAFLSITLSNCAIQPQSAPTASDRASTSDATTSKVLRVGFITSDGSKIPAGLEGWAQAKGYLDQELKSLGISEVKFFPFVGGPALNESLASGALDLGLYGDTPALVGKAAGLKTKLINQARVGQEAWLLTTAKGVKTLADIKGKKVGVAKGTYMHRYLLGLLDQQKLTSTVTLVQIPVADAKAALERGDIVAYPFPTGSGPLLASQGFITLDRAKNHPELAGTSVSIATEDILGKYPQLPQKWNQIRQRALQEVQADAQGFYQFVAKASNNRYPLPIIQESYDIALYPSEPFSANGLKVLNSTKQFLAEQKLLKSDFDIKDWQISKP